MFRPNPAIIRFSSERVSVLICMSIDLISTDTLSDENLMMAGIGRNLQFYIHPLINIVRNTSCVTDWIPLPIISSLFLRQSALQHINHFIGWKSLYGKLIGGPKFGQNVLLIRDLKKFAWNRSLIKWPRQCVQSHDVWWKRWTLTLYKRDNFWITSLNLNSIFQDSPSTTQLLWF